MSSTKQSRIQATFWPAALKRLTGCTVIPLHKFNAVNTKGKPVGKAPLDFNWTKRPYDSSKVIARCVRDNRNMGLRLGPRVVVIDVDPRNGGLEGFESMCADLGLDPDEWPRAVTGSGGFHCFAELPGDVKVRDTLEEYPGVEFKSQGRQVVVAGSRHPNRKLYSWSPDHPDIRRGLPKIPTTLLERITRPERQGGNVDGGTHDQEQIATMLAALDPRDFDSNETWFPLMQAVHHASGGDARQEWIDFSYGDERYSDDTDMIGRRWDSLHAERSDGVTYKTLHKALRDHGAGHLVPANDIGDDFDDGLTAGVEGFGFEGDDDDDSAPATDFESLDPMKYDMVELDAMLDYAESAMALGGAPLYQTAKRLVHPVRMERASEDDEAVRRAAGALTVQDVTALRLNQYMIRHAPFYVVKKAPNGAGAVRKKHAAPLRLAEHMLARCDRWQIPTLTGIIETPTLRRDGSLLSVDGYDVSSGLLLDRGGVTFPAVPDAPSRDDALAALKLLKRPLAGFPFVADGPKGKSASRSVMLSAMLTALTRRSLRSAPMHGFSAPTPGTGKTLAVQVAAVIATGHEVTAMSQGANAEEDEKRLFSVLMQGDQVVLIDNVTHPIGGNALCTILTEEFWQSRMLGFSRNASVATNVLMTASGNNLIFEGDMTRRALLCRMDAGIENPERRSFDVNLKEWVPAHRGQLVAAGLTVLRAFVVAGRPGVSKLSPFGSFEEWSGLVRGALVWLGEPDPCLTRSHIAADDPVKAELGEFLSAVQGVMGSKWFHAGDLLAIDETGFESNADSIMEIIESTIPRVNRKRLGQYLKSHERQIVGGLRLEVTADGHRKINVYRVAACG